jgi:hypothetical protein
MQALLPCCRPVLLYQASARDISLQSPKGKSTDRLASRIIRALRSFKLSCRSTTTSLPFPLMSSDSSKRDCRP